MKRGWTLATLACLALARGAEGQAATEPGRAAGAPAAGRLDAQVAAVTAAAPPLAPWLDRIAAGLGATADQARAGRLADARQTAVRLYLDEYELLETRYGVGGDLGTPQVAARIGAVEGRFHELLRAGTAPAAAALATELRGEVLALRALASSPGAAGGASVPAGTPVTARETAPAIDVRASSLKTRELRTVVAQLDSAQGAYRQGRAPEALSRVERLYLDGIEPLEPRLPQARVHEIERLVHLGVRASIARGAPAGEVAAAFGALRGKLVEADDLLGAGAPPFLGAANAFFVLVREGLEAVLLIAALLAYVTAAGAGARARRQIYAGVGAGVLATGATWALATAVIPMGGESRELVEGITGLVAVAVLLYVSNWLFQKTYIHDWKEYLRQHVGKAVTTGSAVAMASLAFAAVYREGFETVLFYQALLFDAGPGPVLAGALPALLLIGALGIGIIRLGVKLPLKRMFAATNAVLLYLAFTFVGKGLYNLQEAGIFSPHAVKRMPDSGALRQLLGVYPVVETLAAQALFALGVAATYVYYRRRLAVQRRATAAAPGTAASRRVAVSG